MSAISAATSLFFFSEQTATTDGVRSGANLLSVNVMNGLILYRIGDMTEKKKLFT